MKRITLAIVFACLTALAMSQSAVAQTPGTQRFALKRYYHFNQITQYTNPFMVNPKAIAFDGQNMWVGNVNTYGPNNGNIMVLNTSDGTLLCETAIGGASPQALAYDGAYMWVLDSVAGAVYSIQASSCDPDADDGITPVVQGPFNVGGPGSAPYALAFDGNYLWVSNTASNNVIGLAINNGAPTGPTTTISTSTPKGLIFDGNVLWIANSGTSPATGSVSSYKLTAPASDAAPAVFCTPRSAPGGPSALAFDGLNHIYVAYTAGGNGVGEILFTPPPGPAGCSAVTFVTIPGTVGASDILYDGTDLWISTANLTVARYRPAASLSLGSATTQGFPYSLAYDGANVWSTVWSGGTGLGNGYVGKF